jgi:hypothetical protein
MFSLIDSSTLKILFEKMLETPKDFSNCAAILEAQIQILCKKKGNEFWSSLKSLTTSLRALPQLKISQLNISVQLGLLEFLEKPSIVLYNSVVDGAGEEKWGAVSTKLFQYLNEARSNYSNLNLWGEFGPVFEKEEKWASMLAFLPCIFNSTTLPLLTELVTRLSEEKRKEFFEAFRPHVSRVLVDGIYFDIEFPVWEWLLKWCPQMAADIACLRGKSYEEKYANTTVTAQKREVMVQWLRRAKRIYYSSGMEGKFREEVSRIVKRLKTKTSLVCSILSDPFLTSHDLPKPFSSCTRNPVIQMCICGAVHQIIRCNLMELEA